MDAFSLFTRPTRVITSRRNRSIDPTTHNEGTHVTFNYGNDVCNRPSFHYGWEHRLQRTGCSGRRTTRCQDERMRHDWRNSSTGCRKSLPKSSVHGETCRRENPVIAGTGSNSTLKTIETTRLAKELGADAALVVVPYYNKPGPSVSSRTSRQLPTTVDTCRLYNVPGRTGINMPAGVTIELRHIRNIIAVKEASGDLSQVNEFCVARMRQISPY